MVEVKRRDVVVYRLYVAGLFGRNRKPKHGAFPLHEGTIPLQESEVRKLMDTKVAELKVKPGARLHVVESSEWVEDRADGITVRGFRVGQGRSVISATV